MTNPAGKGYTDEVNVQVLVSLMKHHGVCRVVASPGATNVTLVACLQRDPYFTVYSSVDERSAAYMACGIAAETGEPVALSCTGATASRNYIPGLTEAFYRKLPVLAVTSTQHLGRIGHMYPQVIDRTNELNDICRVSVQCPTVHSSTDRWACEANLNWALLELTREGGGPVHVNLVTTYSGNFDVAELLAARAVDRVERGGELPPLGGKRVAVYVGAHRPWSDSAVEACEAFCERYGAVVFCDHTSNYPGAHGVMGALVATQSRYTAPCMAIDVMVHIGEITGAYASPNPRQTWRVSPDGQPRDPFGKLRYVFGMGEEEFFRAYAEVEGEPAGLDLSAEWRAEDARIRAKVPELPFSNIWCAQHTAPMLPEGSVLHLGILNSLRSWNFFPTDPSIRAYCNTGGFGIDGCMSTLIGASLASPEKLFFGVVGDLACFYDLNSLGNRHVARNVRIMVVDNGVGTEFKNFNHKAAAFGEEADAYMAARGHYGNRSHELLRHYAEDLGFEYLCASTKEEFLTAVERFTTPEQAERPMLFEVFTDSQGESDALEAVYSLETNAVGVAKDAVRGILGEKGIAAVKKVLGR